MERVSIDDVEPVDYGGGVERRGLSDPLETTDVAVNRYRLPPGERVAGLHAHPDQEELFVVLDGEVTFERLRPAPDESDQEPSRYEGAEVSVAEDGVVRFAPGEFQSCKNAGDGPAKVLALGAPRETDDVRIPLACPECGHGDVRLDFGADGQSLVCPDCGEAASPACPDCGGEDLRAVLAGDGAGAVSRCRDCGAETEGLPTG